MIHTDIPKTVGATPLATAHGRRADLCVGNGLSGWRGPRRFLAVKTFADLPLVDRHHSFRPGTELWISEAQSSALINGSVGLILAPRGTLSRALIFTFQNATVTQVEVIGDPVRLRELDIGVL